ncbi:hypothetical protein GLAREA_05785 [Glarea lozoyensis ATCC 20868]|uniref:Uncharacterized protein n=1 Tax=Glarea lozoyensis (strain ATCC 20868 / MF5171) TaxID=1116229 RepID=S3DDF4_GLAL2|nr:uncharacterized protein GLAREA_05785 [Glarea lozoyensis ATCC 20868]EPE36447.1 hypothetical protein GLAREA_05785 [Glarea lozoyensis ATCC 20868]
MYFLPQISSFLLLAATISSHLVIAKPVAEVKSTSETKQLSRRVVPAVVHQREGTFDDYVGNNPLPGLPRNSVADYARRRAKTWYEQIPKQNGQDPVKIMAVVCVEGAGCWGGTVPHGDQRALITRVLASNAEFNRAYHGSGANSNRHAEDYAVAKMIDEVGADADGKYKYVAVYGRPSLAYPRAQYLYPCRDNQANKNPGCATMLTSMGIAST